MELKFKVAARISKPVHEVFEAVINPATLSQYFTTGGAQGRLVAGSTVTWDFHDFPGAFPVDVIEVDTPHRIVLRWASDDASIPTDPNASKQTTVTLTFEALEGERTLVTITEEGWQATPSGLKASYGNCGGWMQMLCAMKAYLEHGINLRQGMFA